jgi:uncharacterized membrane protein
MKRPFFTQLWLSSGVIGVVVLLSSIAIAMRRAHLGFIDNRPISYLGLYPNTRMLFSVSLIVSAILFIAFGFYVRRRYDVRYSFLGYFVIGQICQIIVALVPDKAGSSIRIVHTIAGFTLAFSLPFLIRELARSKSTRAYHKIFVALYRIEQVAFVIGIGLFIFVQGIAPLGEALPTLGFDLWIVAVTIISIKMGIQGASNKIKRR